MSERILHGVAAAAGVAIGLAFRYQPPNLTIPRRAARSPEEEWARFEMAHAHAREDLKAIMEKSPKQAGIFEAHLMMLDDPMLHDGVRQRVEAGETIEQALASVVEKLAGMLSVLEDQLFAVRSVDVRDIGQRVLRILLDVPQSSLDTLREPAIVVARDLSPSDIVRLDPLLTLGICTASGTPTSHTTIIARMMGVPAVVGLGVEPLEQIEPGAQLILNGDDGTLIASPQEATLHRYRAIQKRQRARLQVIQRKSQSGARTADGRRVEIGANVGGRESAQDAIRYGAGGVGLLRTEFLFLEEARPLSEEEQIHAYREIFEVLNGRPVIARTLDIRGDKSLPYMDVHTERNHLLELRATRSYLSALDLCRIQLRALLQAAVGHNVHIMYPMINGLDELHQANSMLDTVRDELRAEGVPYAEDIPVGTMVETPAAAMTADILAGACDFLSIGTNDLIQYALAVDRTDARIPAQYESLHPAVIRLIKHTIDAAHDQGKWVGMCGELAGMQKAIPILLGLGLDEFSMAPPAIPQAKWLISQITVEEARKIAKAVLDLSSTAEIEWFMQDTLAQYTADRDESTSK